ncbi:MAG: hypothetical protein H7A37_03400 [Chlamydiales bacterium]|nr:hypothetical protein [Chlamydiia bacterium]MCP5507333.1 hypothetical protein [Chlamydiales bacterium]
MCFSAEASFTASAVLGVTGIITMKSVRNRKQLLVAAIPLLFALQQMSEGFVWLSMDALTLPAHLRTFCEYFFLTFAFLIWPIWIPFAFFTMEEVKWRKILLALVTVAGITLSFFNGSYLPGSGVEVTVVSNSIRYFTKGPQLNYEWMVTVIYNAIVIIPTFLSSYRYMWLWGLAVLTSSIIANYFYYTTYTSVWCFFSAVISIGLYFVLLYNYTIAEKESHTPETH